MEKIYLTPFCRWWVKAPPEKKQRLCVESGLGRAHLAHIAYEARDVRISTALRIVKSIRTIENDQGVGIDAAAFFRRG